MRYVKKRDVSSVFGKDVVRNEMYDEINQRIEDDIVHYEAEGWNTYYATAGFGASSNAKAENAVAKKELYIDIDCGATKPYATKEEGIRALRTFCKELKLPRPTLLDSGNGIHAHWYFTNAVPVHEWKEVAEALKEHHIGMGFNVDGSCTADIVRVLRIPDTVNKRGGATTSLLTPIAYHDFALLKECIGTTQTGMFSKVRALVRASPSMAGMSEIAKLIASNKTSKFEVLWMKSVKGTGCAQVKNAIENSDTLPEPVWRGMLSLAQYCEDRDWGIHKISENHPNYSAEETEKKASDTKGPYTCETFRKMDTHALCVGCAHTDKITSPIQLGTEFRVATKEENKVVVNEVHYEIPSYPLPYYRGSAGGVYRYPEQKPDKKGEKIDSDDEDKQGEKPVTVYPHDIYVFSRSRDIEKGDVVWIRIHLPKDGVREFMIPQAHIGSIDKLRDAVNTEGTVLYSVAQLRYFQDFIGRQVQELQMNEGANSMYTRFGWTPESNFVVGNREYTKDPYALPRKISAARQLDNYVQWFTPKGSVEEWKRIANMYNNEAADMNAFVLCAGFGSVLMNFSGESGGMINLYSKQGGTGKTSTIKLVNSIFGHPDKLLKTEKDTALSKIHRMGIMNGMATTIDELTNSTAEELSNLTYGASQGRARDRMEAGTNAERVNNITWKSITLGTSNASIEDRIGIMKADPQGEMARVLEIRMPAITTEETLESKRLMESMNDNYGVAGDIFLRYVIPNQVAVQGRMKVIQDKLYGMREWGPSDRFKLNILMCALAGGYIAKELGLVDYAMDRIAKKIIRIVHAAAQDQKAKATKSVETFANFVNRYINNILIINDAYRIKGMPDAPLRTPKGPLLIRYEPDTKNLYIAQKEFHKWCAEQFINAKEMQVLFKDETGASLTLEKKRLAKGWETDFGAVNAYRITNATKLLGIDDGGFDVIDIVATAVNDKSQ